MGISVSDWDVVKGFSVIKHIAEGQPISWTDVEPVSKNRPSWVGDVKPKPHFENKVVEHEFVVKILDQFDSDYAINYSLSENPGPTGHYKVQSNGGFLVLTVKNGCDPSRLKLVGSLTDKLHNQGVSVLPFIKTKSGSFAHYQGFWGTLVRFVDGRHAENTISDVKKIATLLSETHLGLQRFPLSRMAKKLTSQLDHEFELSLKHIRRQAHGRLFLLFQRPHFRCCKKMRHKIFKSSGRPNASRRFVPQQYYL